MISYCVLIIVNMVHLFNSQEECYYHSGSELIDNRK